MTNDIVQICYCAFKLHAPSQLFLQKNYKTNYKRGKIYNLYRVSEMKLAGIGQAVVLSDIQRDKIS